MSFIRSKLLILFFRFISLIVLLNVDEWKMKEALAWDIAGYYLYLPANFIYKDPGKLSYYPALDSAYKLSGEEKMFGIYDVPATGKRLDKFPAGVAIFEMPSFFAAHAYASLSKNYPADGYSYPYRLAIGIATIFCVICGLFVLRRFLRRHFTEGVTLLSLLLLMFGTNLYAYTAFEWGMSHSFSFFLFAAFLYCTDLWYSSGKRKYIVWMGLLLGWVVITRPTNIIIALLPLLWTTASCHTLKDKAAMIKQNAGAIVLSAFLFFAMLLVQASYWKYVTGHWIYYSYEKEGFNFLSPHIWDGLFSYRKGWFVYTPMALFIMCGFIFLYRSRRRLVLPVLSFLIITVYIVFSWHAWAYGGSFSSRAMLEGLAILSIPLAAFAEWLLHIKQKLPKLLIATALTLLIALNLFQTYQYSNGVILYDKMTKEHYWAHFWELDTDG